MRNLIFLVTCIITCFHLISVEKEAKTAWEGDIGLGLAITQGNTRTLNLSLSFHTNKAFSKELIWQNSLLYLYNRDQDAVSAESVIFESRLKYEFSKYFFIMVQSQFLRDLFKDYTYRINLPVSVGINLVKSSNLKLLFHNGITVVIAKYMESSERKSYIGWQGGNQLIWQISKTAQFSQTTGIVFNLQRVSQYFSRVEISLSAALTKSWILTLTLIDTYDSLPLRTDIKKNDLSLLSGLAYKF